MESNRETQAQREGRNDGLPLFVDVPLLDVDDSMVQGELFPDSLLETEQVRMGYRGSAASRAAGITYRQLDYWAHKHIVEPSVTASHGSGSRRLYSFNDVLMLAACKKLLDLGVNLQNISQTLQFLRAYRSTQLSHMVIVCDGEHVRACEGETMFADVLQHESAVFIIAVGALFRQVESSLAAAESVAVTSDVALRHLSVDSDDCWLVCRLSRKAPDCITGTRTSSLRIAMCPWTSMGIRTPWRNISMCMKTRGVI